jgi:glycosyltransferase involved in cell wall biosynthesis
LIGLFYKPLGVKFIYDQHDICPEVFEAKFGKKGIIYRILSFWERLSYRVADLVIVTNNSYREIAIQRGKLDPEKVFVVRTGPDLSRIPKEIKKDESLRKGKRFMVGYVGVIEKQEGLDYLVEVVKEIVETIGRKDILFMIIGSGTQLPYIKELVKRSSREF